VIAYLVSHPMHPTRVVVSDDPIPALEASRLERAGFRVVHVPNTRARSEQDWTNLVTPLLQVDLFA
jgi:hypothetical protein